MVVLNRLCFFTIIGFLTATSAWAQNMYYGAKPDLNVKITVEEFSATIPKGSIVIIGEQHNFQEIQQGQLAILKTLRNQGHNINVGLEFLNYNIQKQVDDFRSGKISEEVFKKSAWGEADFNKYRDQLLFPNAQKGETTFAINSPKEIPVMVKTKGLANLSEEEKKLLPPNFQVGGPAYRERFKERMAGHVADEEAMNRYFEAQSVWDDTMAWKVCEAAKTSNNTLVIVVGQFHVENNDGVVARIHERCNTQKVTTVFQYLLFSDEAEDLSPLAPSPKYGPLSDYLMVVKEQ
ncbi:MAG: ChaN family lipoprotein [Bdellovibrio sp.]